MIKNKDFVIALYGVIAGGSRRTYKVYSTLLYPFFAETESIEISSSVKSGGGLSAPYQDFMGFGSMILSGGEISPLPVIEYDAGNEDMDFSSLILAGGIIRDIRIDYIQQDAESLSMASSVLTGGEVKTVAVRYNSSTFDTENINFSSAILAGGTVGA